MPTSRMPLLLAILMLVVGYAAPPPPASAPLEIRIPAWLDHEPGRALATSDFHVTIDGSEAPVLAIERPGDDLILLLVLDFTSGDLTVIDPAKAALLDEVRKLPATTYIGLLRAEDNLHVLKDPTSNRDEITGEIALPVASGKPGLLPSLETLGHIGDAMLKKSTVRVGIVYVSDADVRNYREDFSNPVINSSDSHDLSRRFPEALVHEKVAKLEAKLAAQQTPLFIADLGLNSDRLNQAYHNGLKQLAETTGGAAFFSPSVTEIPEVIHKVIEAAQSHYSLTVSVPEHASARLQIRLTGPEGERPLNYRTHLLLPRR